MPAARGKLCPGLSDGRRACKEPVALRHDTGLVCHDSADQGPASRHSDGLVDPLRRPGGILAQPLCQEGNLRSFDECQTHV